MSRRAWLLLVLLAIAVAACKHSATSTTISFAVFGDAAELAAYELLVDSFETAHGEIDVELRYVPGQDEYRRRLAIDFAGGAPPDVMLLNYRRFSAFSGQEGLKPLGRFLANSSVIAEEDFYAPALDAFRFDGQLWCIPQNVSSLVVFYNLDLFDAASLPYPDAQWTREEFLHAARVLTQDQDGDGRTDQFGVGIDPTLYRLAPFIWQDGGELVDDPVQPTRLLLDQGVALAAFQWFVDLQAREHVVPDAVAEAAESSESRFLNGTLAMVFNSRRGVPTYRTISGFGWDVAPLPLGEYAAGILHSDGYCLAARARHEDAAWSLIEYANSVVGQSLVATSGRTVPSLRSVAVSPAFLDPSQPPASNHLFIDSIPSLHRVPVVPSWAVVEEMTNREIERAFYGQVSVGEAAAAAVDAARSLFAGD